MITGSLVDGVIALWPLVSAIAAAVIVRRAGLSLLFAPLIYAVGRFAFAYAGLLSQAPIELIAANRLPELVATLAMIEIITLCAIRFAMMSPSSSNYP